MSNQKEKDPGVAIQTKYEKDVKIFATRTPNILYVDWSFETRLKSKEYLKLVSTPD
jgi:preprotein translocase subunit SecB